MATWTTITDAALDPGKPIRSIDGLALRDNPIAIAEGAAGAPKVENAAFDDDELSADKFQETTTERDWILSLNATAGLGAVGTYALMRSPGISVGAGSTTAGSNLDYSNASGSTTTGSPAGTWKAMGTTSAAGSPSDEVSLFLRVS